MFDLSIVVLHYNRWDLTRECLASIDTQEIPCHYEKVLVDNGSMEPVPPLDSSWRVVRYHNNKGHIVGQNRCFESVQGTWVLFVANDVRLQPRCIYNLWGNRRGITQPQLWSSSTQRDNCGLRWQWPGYGISVKRYQECPDSVTSTCYLIKKKYWNELEGFDKSLFSSHEDIDFNLRLRKRNIFIGCDPYAQASHLGNATLKYQASHTRAAFHHDRVYVVRKHYRGLDRALRLLCIAILDTLSRLYHWLV